MIGWWKRFAAVRGPVRCWVCFLMTLVLAASAASQDQVLDQIRAHRKTLLGPDPAPVGNASRRLALATLVRMDHEEAHAVLGEVLAAYPDPQKAPIETIGKLLDLLTQEEAVDLADAALAELEKNPKVKRRLAIYRSYVPSLVRLHQALGKVEPASDEAAAAKMVLTFFARLPGDVCRPDLKAIFTQNGTALRASAIRIAGETKDPRMAPELAPLLSDLELRPLVQDALASLTLRPQTFRDAADFDAWWKENSAKSYSELMLDAAKQARAAAKSIEAEHEKKRAELLNLLFERAKRILELGLTQPAPPWAVFLEDLQSPELTGHRARLLETFYRVVRGRTYDPKDLQPGLADLGRLHDFLKAQFATAGGEERPACLAAYTMCSNLLGEKARQDAEALLLDLLGSGADNSRVLDLLGLFRTDLVRDRVLAVLQRVLTPEATLAALACLQSLGISGDKALADRTIGFLDKTVLDRAQDPRVRELALNILGGSDRPQVLDALRKIVGITDPELAPENLRSTALAWVVTQVESQLLTRPGGEIEIEARKHLSLLFSCITDRVTRIRVEAARALEKFPPASAAGNFSKQFLRDTAGLIIAQIGEQLRSEREPSCLRQMRATLMMQATNADIAEAALNQLTMVLVAWAKDEVPGAGNGATSFLKAQVPLVIPDLERLLKGKGIQPVAALRLAEKLLVAGLPEVAGVLAGARVCAELDQATTAGAADQEQAKALVKERDARASLILKIVEAAGDFDRLEPKERTRVDALLVSAMQGVQAVTGEKPIALVWLGQALARADRHAEAATILGSFLDDYGKDAPTQRIVLVRRLLAAAHMRSGRSELAAKMLEGQTDVESRLLRGEALHKCASYVEAERVFAALVAEEGVAGAVRENAQAGLAAALLAQDKLDAVVELLAKLPEFADTDARAKLVLIQSELKAKQSKKEAQGGGRAGPSGETPAQPDGAPGK